MGDKRDGGELPHPRPRVCNLIPAAKVYTLALICKDKRLKPALKHKKTPPKCIGGGWFADFGRKIEAKIYL